MLKEMLMEAKSNDEVMYQEELKDIAGAIMNAWHRAKFLDIDYEEFLHTVKKVSDGALQDLED